VLVALVPVDLSDVGAERRAPVGSRSSVLDRSALLMADLLSRTPGTKLSGVVQDAAGGNARGLSWLDA
jgi:hypothetical protein